MTTDPNTIIDALGGTSKVAEMCGITTGAVSQWRSSGAVPKPWLKFFQAARPDLFAPRLRKRPRKAA